MDKKIKISNRSKMILVWEIGNVLCRHIGAFSRNDARDIAIEFVESISEEKPNE